MKRKLYIWRYPDQSTEYVDVIAYNEGVDPMERLLARVPGNFGVRSTADKTLIVVLERELAT